MMCPSCEKEANVAETGRKKIGSDEHVEGMCENCTHPLWMHTSEGRWRDRVLDRCMCL